MFLAKEWTSSVLSGYILMIFTTAVLLFFFVNHFKRLKKMKSIWSENNYLNKKLYNFFNFYVFVGFIPMFICISIFFVINLIFSETKYLGAIFTFCYLTYTVQVLIYILILNLKQNSIIAFEYENQLVLFNEVIKLNSILEIKHNLKRTVIFITFRDEKNLEDILKLSYNWQLFDFLKSLNLKITN